MSKLFDFDKEIALSLSKIIVGIDEVGRGPGAGPVYACAYSFYSDFVSYLDESEKVMLTLINDSKKLSERKRELLFDEIIQKSVAYAIAWASPEEIDRLNILQATFL